MGYVGCEGCVGCEGYVGCEGCEGYVECDGYVECEGYRARCSYLILSSLLPLIILVTLSPTQGGNSEYDARIEELEKREEDQSQENEG